MCGQTINTLLILCVIGFLAWKEVGVAFGEKPPEPAKKSDMDRRWCDLHNRIHSLERRGLRYLNPKEVKKGMRVWVFDAPEGSPWPTTVIRVNEMGFYYDCKHPIGCEHSRRFKDVQVWVEDKTNARR